VGLWALAQNRGYGHRSLVTPERVLSEYNEDLICFFEYFTLIKLLYFISNRYQTKKKKINASVQFLFNSEKMEKKSNNLALKDVAKRLQFLTFG